MSKMLLVNLSLSTKSMLIRARRSKALGKTRSKNVVKGVVVVVTELQSLTNSEDNVDVVDNKICEDVVVDVAELEVFKSDAVELVVDEGFSVIITLGGLVVANDPLISVTLFGSVSAAGETRGSVRALLLEIDARVVGVKAFAPELEVKVLVEVSDVDVFKTLVVESSGGDVLF